MSYRYRYTHKTPSVFAHMQKDGHTWTPNLGDEIELSEPALHPHLERIKDEPPVKLIKDEPPVKKAEVSVSAVADGDDKE